MFNSAFGKKLDELKSALCHIKSGLPVMIFASNNDAIIVYPISSAIINSHNSLNNLNNHNLNNHNLNNHSLNNHFINNRIGENHYILLSSEKIYYHTEIQIKNSKLPVKNYSDVVNILDNISDSIKNFIELSQLDEVAIKIAKKAEVEPLLVTTEKKFQSYDDLKKFAFENNIFLISLDFILDTINYEEIIRISEANLNLKDLKDDIKCKFIVYQSQLKESYAIIIGDLKNFKNPLVRIHSSCYTGDLLHSLACDCRDQLHSAIHHIADDSEGGIVVYLMQEGRGIGLSNKIKTYQLQKEHGLDTIQANLALGFKDDERDFSIAGLILKDLDVKNIRLITNNPRKIQDLQRYGINIASRVKLKIFRNKYNEKYLNTKFEKLGHIL